MRYKKFEKHKMESLFWDKDYRQAQKIIHEWKIWRPFWFFYLVYLL